MKAQLTVTESTVGWCCGIERGMPGPTKPTPGLKTARFHRLRGAMVLPCLDTHARETPPAGRKFDPSKKVSAGVELAFRDAPLDLGIRVGRRHRAVGPVRPAGRSAQLRAALRLALRRHARRGTPHPGRWARRRGRLPGRGDRGVQPDR
ncbi:hypothetical protein MILUP08_41942 [Micromonospora lupini str. Lupac 08]|uniref:Uncharacterized protein n=1 Tax=Micromonospora lupini str. Lupac 08 TaxID=1150864 RepID=I0KZM6_9ACTN|nr:hypothetical protein MILUP08_41942 [Micromonospora lupini str. Lupac 08]